MLCSKRAACSTPVAAFPAVPRKAQNNSVITSPLVSAKGGCRSRALVAWAAEAAPITAPKTSDMKKYETLIVLKPTLTDEERDQELARFESFLLSVRLYMRIAWLLRVTSGCACA